MKRALRMVALVVWLGALGLWLAGGADRGWTKTSVPVQTLDKVTGLEGIEYHPRFVPGVDFVAAAAVLAFVLGGLSFLFHPRQNPQSETADRI